MKTKLVKVKCITQIDDNKKYQVESMDRTEFVDPAEFAFSLVCKWVRRGELYEAVEVNWWENIPEEGLLLVNINDSSRTQFFTKKEILEEYNMVTKYWRPATKEDIDRLKELV
ncbi:hypothetical protein [uncultured Mediterranean phage uvMED]|nr:hypothetical protein [uncultured Mediterranean phage uvMED]